MIRRIRIIFGLIVAIIAAGYYLMTFIQDRRTVHFDILDRFTVSAPGYWKVDTNFGIEDADLALITREEDASIHFVILSKEEMGIERLEDFAQLMEENTKQEDPEYELKPVKLESYEKAFHAAGIEQVDGDSYAINEYLVERDGYYVFGSAWTVEGNSAKGNSELRNMLISLESAE